MLSAFTPMGRRSTPSVHLVAGQWIISSTTPEIQNMDLKAQRAGGGLRYSAAVSATGTWTSPSSMQSPNKECLGGGKWAASGYYSRPSVYCLHFCSFQPVFDNSGNVIKNTGGDYTRMHTTGMCPMYHPLALIFPEEKGRLPEWTIHRFAIPSALVGKEGAWTKHMTVQVTQCQSHPWKSFNSPWFFW